MHIDISPDPEALGRRAAVMAAERLRSAIARQGSATMIVATGASQFSTLASLVDAPDIAWGKVTVFHLDEYLGLDDSHPASFVRYLRERFVDRVPDLAAFHPIDGTVADPQAFCRELGERFRQQPIDVACIGIGENGHLAFNDPPADLTTDAVYHVVALDEACRQQQVGEGWFPDMNAVPTHAISMTIPAILTCRSIVCSVPDARKAQAVHDGVCTGRDPLRPATALQEHGDCGLFLDTAAASLLPAEHRP